MYVLAALLVIGFFCNLAVKPVDPRYYMTQDEVPASSGPGRLDRCPPLHKVYVRWILLRLTQPPRFSRQEDPSVANPDGRPQSRASKWLLVLLAWLPVTIPLLWGIWQTVKKASVLF